MTNVPTKHDLPHRHPHFRPVKNDPFAFIAAGGIITAYAFMGSDDFRNLGGPFCPTSAWKGD
jgi:hypothetical protein